MLLEPFNKAEKKLSNTIPDTAMKNHQPSRFVPPIPFMMKISQQGHESVGLVLGQRIIIVVRVVSAIAGFREDHYDQETRNRQIGENQIAPVAL